MLGTPSRSPLDGSVVVFYSCVDGPEQVLDLANGGTADGTPIIAHPYHAGKNQLWKLQQVDTGSIWPAFIICNVQSDTVMDLYLGGVPDGTPVYGWTAGTPANTHHLWYLVTADTDYKIVQIQNTGSETVVELPDSPPTVSGHVQICGAGGKMTTKNTRQLWKMVVIE